MHTASLCRSPLLPKVTVDCDVSAVTIMDRASRASVGRTIAAAAVAPAQHPALLSSPHPLPPGHRKIATGLEPNVCSPIPRAARLHLPPRTDVVCERQHLLLLVPAVDPQVAETLGEDPGLPRPGGAITRAGPRRCATAAAWSGARSAALGRGSGITRSRLASTISHWTRGSPRSLSRRGSRGPPSTQTARPSGRRMSPRPSGGRPAQAGLTAASAQAQRTSHPAARRSCSKLTPWFDRLHFLVWAPPVASSARRRGRRRRSPVRSVSARRCPLPRRRPRLEG